MGAGQGQGCCSWPQGSGEACRPHCLGLFLLSLTEPKRLCCMGGLDEARKHRTVRAAERSLETSSRGVNRQSKSQQRHSREHSFYETRRARPDLCCSWLAPRCLHTAAPTLGQAISAGNSTARLTASLSWQLVFLCLGREHKQISPELCLPPLCQEPLFVRTALSHFKKKICPKNRLGVNGNPSRLSCSERAVHSPAA